MPNTKQRSRTRTKRPSPDKIRQAIADLIAATGIERPELERTPERVARMWIESLIDGEGKTPHELISRPLRTKSRDLIVMKGIDVHSVCPHHLLPYPIMAHVAFIPNGYTAGFSRIADFVEACAHRLLLLEDLADLVVEGLTDVLRPTGVACLLESKQSCMLYQGRARRENQVTAMAFRGVLASDERRRKEALALLR